MTTAATFTEPMSDADLEPAAEPAIDASAWVADVDSITYRDADISFKASLRGQDQAVLALITQAEAEARELLQKRLEETRRQFRNDESYQWFLRQASALTKIEAEASKEFETDPGAIARFREASGLLRPEAQHARQAAEEKLQAQLKRGIKEVYEDLGSQLETAKAKLVEEMLPLLAQLAGLEKVVASLRPESPAFPYGKSAADYAGIIREYTEFPIKE